MNKISIIRFTLLWGIIADLAEAIMMTIPSVFISASGLNLQNNFNFQFGLLAGMPVMFGWSFILFWAYFKPVERRGVFLCLIPVLFIYIFVELFGIYKGIAIPVRLFPIFVMQLILIFLCIKSYLSAEKIQKDGNSRTI
jgi:hypothetical protein